MVTDWPPDTTIPEKVERRKSVLEKIKPTSVIVEDEGIDILAEKYAVFDPAEYDGVLIATQLPTWETRLYWVHAGAVVPVPTHKVKADGVRVYAFRELEDPLVCCVSKLIYVAPPWDKQVLKEVPTQVVYAPTTTAIQFI
jgi:hypothetical protein